MDARLRDILLFITGFAVLLHETVFDVPSSPPLVGAALAMMIGAPAVYRILDHLDKRTSQKEDDE